MDNIDAAEEWLDSWAAGVSAEAERSFELSRRVAATTGAAESRDGSIRITVGSTGQVEQLELADADLAREILAVMRRAQADLTARVAQQVQATVGADTETGRAVLQSFGSRFLAPGDDRDE